MLPDSERALVRFLNDRGFVATTYPFKNNPARILPLDSDSWQQARVLFPKEAVTAAGSLDVDALFKSRLFFAWDPCRIQGLTLRQGVLQFQRTDKPPIQASSQAITTWFKENTTRHKEHPWKGWYCNPSVAELTAEGYTLTA